LGALTPLALPRTTSRLPDDLVSGFELLEQISNALEQLSDSHRNVVVLREVMGMNYGEIAETLGCAKGTVMSRLFHARERLQASLSGIHSEHFSDEGGATGNQM
jgi:RNA polymerase sigma-70 factor (ECF subfamily)